MTVAQLIEALNAFAPTDKVVATWEGSTMPISVYAGAPGVVLIDADCCSYRERFEGKLNLRGGDAA